VCVFMVGTVCPVSLLTIPSFRLATVAYLPMSCVRLTCIYLTKGNLLTYLKAIPGTSGHRSSTPVQHVVAAVDRRDR